MPSSLRASAAILPALALAALLAATGFNLRDGAPPAADAAFVQYGVATWYGPGFEGNVTYCGQIYNSAEYTAASNTLPCGTRVVVTNTDTEAAVEVVITDRGAFQYPIIVDLSARAFSHLAHNDKGVVPVRVTPME